MNSYPIAGNPAIYNTLSIPAYRNYSTGNFTQCTSDTLLFFLGFCPTDSVQVGGRTYYFEGNFVDSTVNSSGCKVYLKLNLSHYTKPTISATWFLTSSIGNQYQWYFNDTLLVDDSLQTLPIYKNGIYKVAVTDSNGCRQFSDSISVNSTELQEHKSDFYIYPNPITNYMVIKSGRMEQRAFQLISLDGKVLMEWMMSGFIQQVNLTHLSSGAYIVIQKGTADQRTIIKN